MQRAVYRQAVGKEDELRLLRSRIARRADKNLARDALHRRKSAFDEKRDRRANALDRFGIHDAAPMQCAPQGGRQSPLAHSHQWAHIAAMLNNPLFLTVALVAVVLAYGIYVIVY
jgi:hypothetical protein